MSVSAEHALAARDDGSVFSWGVEYDSARQTPTTGRVECAPADPETPPASHLTYCNVTPVPVANFTLRSPAYQATSYDAMHSCAPSVQWAAVAGAGVCPAFGTFSTVQTDLAVPGRGVPLDLTRTYNSADATEAGFGHGWSFLYGMRVTPELGGTVLVRRADGRLDRYIPLGGGGYTPPPGIYDTLARAADGTSTLTTTDQVVYRFNAVGQLTSAVDRNGNTTTLEWWTTEHANNTGGLDIIEPSGRSFVLSYGPSDQGLRFTRLRENGVLDRIISYGYSAAGDLETITDPRGNTLRMTYDTQHHLLTITDQEQRGVLTNTYDTQGRVKTQRDLAGALSAFDYPAATKTTVNGPRTDVNDTTTYEYDADFRSAKITDPLDGTTIVARDAQNQPGTVTDRHGGSTVREFDAQGNVTKLTDPAGNVTEAGYNARNDPTWIKDGNLNTTSFDYDGRGNLYIAHLPLGKAITYEYDTVGKGDLIKETDQDGFATVSERDQYGYPKSVTDPAGVKMLYSYGKVGRLSLQEDALGLQIIYGRAAPTAPNEELMTSYFGIDGNSRDEKVTYDKAGWVATTRDANGRVTRYTYDPALNQDMVKEAQNTADPITTTYAYDPAGNLRTLTDQRGLVTAHTYDPLGRPLTVTGPDPQNGQGAPVTTYNYIDAERKVTQTGPIAGRQIVAVSDPLGRPATVTYPQGDAGAQAFTLTYEYDGVGNRKRLGHSLLGDTTYSYDALDRLTSVTSPRVGSTPVTVGYQYDQPFTQPGDPLDGKPICMKLIYPPSGVDQVARSLLSCPDAAGRLNWVRDWNGKQTTYHYDADGRLDTMAYPNDTKATYRYDGLNRLKEVLNERTAGATALTVRAASVTPAAPAPSGTATPAAGGAVRAAPPPLTNTAVDLEDPGLPLSAFVAGTITDHLYTLDEMGNRTGVTELTAEPGGQTPTSTTYQYDEHDRLKQVTYPGTPGGAAGATYGYRYHPNGDRRFVSIDGQDQPELVYDQAGRLMGAPSGTYDYDKAGNQTRRTAANGGIAEEFAYNGAGQLVKHQARGGSGVATDIAWYDGDGLRLLSYRDVSTSGTHTVWDRNRSLPTVLVEYGPSETTYTITGLGLIARVAVSGQGGEQYLYYHADGLGSTRAITNAGGATVRAYSYDAFGGARGTAWAAPGTVVDNSYGFTGEPFDGGTGSYYLRARHYDPATGRFTQPDPLGDGGGGNQYAYAGNNPATYVDPNGQHPLLAAAWLVAEVGLTAYDIYDTGRTLADPNASAGEKALSVGLTVAGIVGPGAGYNAARKLAPRVLSRLAKPYTVAFEMTLDAADIGTSRSVHTTRAQAALREARRSDATFAARLESEIPDFYSSRKWVWHHHSSRVGVMQLVPSAQHTKGSAWWRTMHPDGARGGYENWAIPAGASPR